MWRVLLLCLQFSAVAVSCTPFSVFPILRISFYPYFLLSSSLCSFPFLFSSLFLYFLHLFIPVFLSSLLLRVLLVYVLFFQYLVDTVILLFIYLKARSRNCKRHYLLCHVCPSGRMEQLGSHSANFHEICLLNIFR